MKYRPTLKVSSLAFAMWFLLGANSGITFLLFHDAPVAGTALQALTPAIGLIFVIFQVFCRKTGHAIPWTRTEKILVFYLFWIGISLSWTAADSVTSAA